MTRRQWMVGLAGVLIIASGAATLLRLKAIQRLGEPGVKLVKAGADGRLEVPLPERVRQYASTNIPITEVERTTLPADTTFDRRLYTAPGGVEVMLMVVLMGTDRTSIHKPEFCLTSQGWQILHQETTRIRMAQPHAYNLPVRKFVTSRAWRDDAGEIHRLNGVYTFWFVSANRVTASHLARIGYLTLDLLRTGVLPRWAYISCFTVCSPGEEDAAFEREKQFIQAAVPEFQTVAPPAPKASSAMAQSDREARR
jgi:hypothetical protein